MDNINVKGCKYYVENNGVEAQGCYELTDLCECNKENEFCDNNPNCYYKQLKRKEQECEQLSNAYEACKDSRLKAYNTIDMLEKECEELKKALKEKTNEYNKFAFNYDAYVNMAQKLFVEKEQECERLEKQNEILLGQLVINDGEDVTVQISQSQFEEYNQLKTENKRLDHELYMTVEEGRAWYDLMERYEQTLAEIKEVLLKTPTDNQEHCVNVKGVILQKISEVGDET